MSKIKKQNEEITLADLEMLFNSKEPVEICVDRGDFCTKEVGYIDKNSCGDYYFVPTDDGELTSCDFTSVDGQKKDGWSIYYDGLSEMCREVISISWNLGDNKVSDVQVSPDNFKVKLKELPGYAVKIENKDEYDEFMSMCEDVGWKWASGDIPRYYNFSELIEYDSSVSLRPIMTWNDCGERTNISFDELKQKLLQEGQPIFVTMNGSTMPKVSVTIKDPEKKEDNYKTNIKTRTMLQTISRKLKKVLNKSEQALYRAGFLDSQTLDLTPEGRDLYVNCLYESGGDHKSAKELMAEEAQVRIEEEEQDN